MGARIATAIEQRLRLVLEVAGQTLEAPPEPLNTASVLAATDCVSGKSLADDAQSGSGSGVVPGGAEGI